MQLSKLRFRRQKHSDTVKRWSNAAQAEFFRLLADLLQAGFSLADALNSLEKLLPKLPLATLKMQVSQTGMLAETLKRHVSQNTYHQLVIAEQHGSLDESIAQLGRLLLRRVEQQKRLKSLLGYPLFLLVLVVSLMIGVNQILAPMLAENSSSKVNLDLIGDVIVGSVWVILGALVAYGIIFVIYWWRKQTQLSRHLWYSTLPIGGRIYRSYSYYYLSYNLALLLQSGMSLEQICQFLAMFNPKTLLYQLGEKLQIALTQGDDVDQFIKRYPFIPQELALFVNKGQTKEKLAVELLLYSKLMYQKLMRQVDSLIGWVQPVMFIVIAVAIVGVYLAILLPLYQNMGGLSI